jgi:monofunctional glycosyltransferase
MAESTPARRWIGRAALALLATGVLVQLWFLGWILVWKWHDPGLTAFMRADLERRAHAPASARPGAKPALQHLWVDYARFSGNIKRAVVATEDQRFLSHDGVDWEAIEQAYRDNQRHGRTTRGGSTISQQLAKNLFLSAQRSYLRKIEEAVIALMIEATWSKRRILEVYLNVVEWGDGVYGAEAAARHYYGEPAAALGVEEAARMAAMLPNPRYFDHHRDSAYIAQRAEFIRRYLADVQIP